MDCSGPAWRKGQCPGRPSPPHQHGSFPPPIPVSHSAKQGTHLQVGPPQTPPPEYPRQGINVLIQDPTFRSYSKHLFWQHKQASLTTQWGMNEPCSHPWKGLQAKKPLTLPLPLSSKRPGLLSSGSCPYPQGTPHSPQKRPFITNCPDPI